MTAPDGPWVFKSSEYRLGQTVEEGLILRGNVVPPEAVDGPWRRRQIP